MNAHRLSVPALTLMLTLAACAQPPSQPPAESEPEATAPAEAFPVGNDENWLEPEYITASLRSIDEIFPVRIVPRSSAPSAFSRRAQPLELSYEYDGETHSLADFPARTGTTGLLILLDDEILHEAYFRGADESSHFLSMSVAKSFTSTLLGIARGEGLIASFDDPVTRYLPELAGTGYDGVAIKNILQMSSGVDFVEEYDDPESDIARLGDACFGGPERVREVAVTYGRKREPGSDFYYASVDTLILGMLLERVTETRLADYMAEKLWQPLGAEADAYWVLDQPGDDGIECALGGFNATLRDYARFGALMAHDGEWNGQRILPEDWVAEATIPSSPQVQPGELIDGYPLGYQYQWWTFPDEHHSFTGEGIHGQLLMVDPVLGLVLAKTSDWQSAWEGAKEEETWALFDAAREWVTANRPPA